MKKHHYLFLILICCLPVLGHKYINEYIRSYEVPTLSTIPIANEMENDIVAYQCTTPPPTAKFEIFLFSDQTNKLSDVSVTGTNIKWYSQYEGGTALPANTTLTDQAYYYASQTVNGCESTDRLFIETVKVNNKQKYCNDNLTLADLDLPNLPSDTNLLFSSATSTVPLLNSTPLKPGTYYLETKYIGISDITTLTDQISQPFSIEELSDGKFLIGQTNTNKIFKLNENGTVEGEFADLGEGHRIGGITQLSNGEILASTVYGRKIVRYNSAGVKLDTITLQDSKDAYLAPKSILELNNGSFLTTYSNISLITQYHLDGTRFIPLFISDFELSSSIIQTEDRRFWATEENNGYVSRFEENGSGRKRFKVGGNPTAIVEITPGILWITDRKLGVTEMQTDDINPENPRLKTIITTQNSYFSSIIKTSKNRVLLLRANGSNISELHYINSFSNRIKIEVTGNTAPPTSENSIHIFSDKSSTLKNLLVTGNNIKWYSQATGGNALPENKTLIDGDTYYATQTIDGCESTTRLPIQVKEYNNQQTICNDNATVANIAFPNIANHATLFYNSTTATTPIPHTAKLKSGDYYANLRSINHNTPVKVYGGFKLPHSLTKLSDGSILVGEVNNAIIHKIQADGTGKSVFATLDSGRNVFGITRLSNGEVWATNEDKHLIMRYNESGVLLGTIDKLVDTPRGILEIEGGSVLVTMSRGNIHQYALDGSPYFTSFALNLKTPLGMTQTMDRKIWVAEFGSNYISRFDEDGNNKQQFVVGEIPTHIVEIVPGILWITFENGEIKQMRTDDPNPNSPNLITIVSDLGNLRDIIKISDGKALFTSGNKSTIYELTYTESTSNQVKIKVIGSTPAPTAEHNIYLFSNENSTLMDVPLTSNGAVKWYTEPTGGSPISNTTKLINGTTYYASQTLNNCESTNRLSIQVNWVEEKQEFDKTNLTLANLDVPTHNSATSIFYDSPSSTVLLPNTTALAEKSYYVELAGFKAGGTKTLNSNLQYPSKLNELSDGSILVGDSGNGSGNTYQIQADGSEKKTFIDYDGEERAGRLIQLTNGDILATSNTEEGITNKITRYNSLGVKQNTFYTETGFAPTALVQTKNGDVLVGNEQTGKIYKFDVNGTLLSREFITGLNANTYSFIQTADHNIWVLEAGSGYISRFDENGKNRTRIKIGLNASSVTEVAPGILWIRFNEGIKGDVKQLRTNDPNLTTIFQDLVYPSDIIRTSTGKILLAALGQSKILEIDYENYSSNRAKIDVSINVPAPTATYNIHLFADENTTLTSLEVQGEAIKWYDQETGGTPIPLGTKLIDGTTYYASQTINNFESKAREAIQARWYEKDQIFCKEGFTLGELTVPTENKDHALFFDSSSATTPLPKNTVVKEGSYFFEIKEDSSSDGGVKRQSNRVRIEVKKDEISAPSTPSSTQQFCIQNNPTLNEIEIVGSNIKWYTSATGDISLAANTPLVHNTTYYAAQISNGCESVKRTPVTVLVDNPIIEFTTPKITFTYGQEVSDIYPFNELDGFKSVKWYTSKDATDFTISTPKTATFNIGKYSYWVSGVTESGCESERTEIIFEINPVSLTITADPKSKAYGEKDPELTYTVSGLLPNDKAENIVKGNLTRETGENVGDYLINQGTLEVNPNYILSKFNSAVLKITAVKLIITAEPKTKMYGEKDPELTYTVSGLLPNDKAEDIVKGSLTREAGESIGDYKINKGSLAVSTNYTIETFNSAVLKIAAAKLTITADPKTKVYGEKDPKLTFSVTGLLNSDKAEDIVKGALARQTGENVGEYKINKDSLTVHSNYVLTAFNDANLSITPAQLNIMANPISKEFGQQDPELTFTQTGLLPHDDINKIITGSLKREPGENRGKYPILIGTLTLHSNYVLGTFKEATFEITKANQTINFETVDSVILEDNPSIQLTATASSGLAITYSLSDNNIASIDANGVISFSQLGTVTITASQEGDNNYNPATPVTQTIEVTTRDLSIWDLVINGESYGKVEKEVFVTLDCDESTQDVIIDVITQKGVIVSPSNRIVIPLTEYGMEKQIITLSSTHGGNTETYTVWINRRIPTEKIVTQKYNNILLVNNTPRTNGGYKFTSFKWLKDGVTISTEQMYSAGENIGDTLDPNAEYRVELTLANGKTIMSCPIDIQDTPQKGWGIYPNPVKKNSMINLQLDVQSSQEVIAYQIYDIKGQMITKGDLPQGNREIFIPATFAMGSYFLVIKVNGEQKSFQFIVRN